MRGEGKGVNYIVKKTMGGQEKGIKIRSGGNETGKCEI